MKQRGKKLLSLALALCLCLTLVPTAALAANSDFTIEDGVLTKYNGNNSSVTIPEGVTSIGFGAFQTCTGLTSVTIPESVTSIGGAAFSGCASLASVTIPKSVTEIGNGAFDYTPWQKSLGEFAIVNGILFKYQGDGGDVTIPEGVTSIGDSAFSSCYSLTSVTIPAGVTSIGDSAFLWCHSLTSVTIPAGVTSIGEDAFDKCTSLTSVTIPEGVTSIGDWAFNGCSSLTSVTIPESVTSIGYCSFNNCSGLASVTIPKSVTEIGNGAFNYTPWQKSLGEFAIINGILLKYQGDGGNVVIPNGVTRIGGSAFYACENLTSVTIPEGVTNIGYGAFYNCKSLTSVTIPKSVTSIDDDVFHMCESLTIYGVAGSYAETYAKENDIPFVAGEAPAAPSTLAAPTAYPSTQTVLVDGAPVTFHAYALKDANGYPTNYIKLRDVAAILNGSAAQFEVGWDGSITITTKTAYTPNGTENIANFEGDQSYTVNTAPVKVNGAEAGLEAITLTDESGGGYTYFKLRDLGDALGFNVSWDGATGISIDSTSPYDPAN